MVIPLFIFKSDLLLLSCRSPLYILDGLCVCVCVCVREPVFVTQLGSVKLSYFSLPDWAEPHCQPEVTVLETSQVSSEHDPSPDM